MASLQEVAVTELHRYNAATKENDLRYKTGAAESICKKFKEWYDIDIDPVPTTIPFTIDGMTFTIEKGEYAPVIVVSANGYYGNRISKDLYHYSDLGKFVIELQDIHSRLRHERKQ